MFVCLAYLLELRQSFFLNGNGRVVVNVNSWKAYSTFPIPLPQNFTDYNVDLKTKMSFVAGVSKFMLLLLLFLSIRHC